MAAVKSEVKIVKASGNAEPFDPNVITSECVEAGIEFFTAADVALELSKHIYDGISTKEIQDSMVKILYQKNPAAAERYKRFRSMLVRTSRNTIEPFDRKKISNSLLKETNLPRELAETVAKESEEELRKLKLDFISAPLIREVVNVKLLEHGLEEARADYTRLGMPVYDAAQLIEVGEKKTEALRHLMADNIFKEYTLLKVLPRHIADGHMRGELHIHGLEYFVAGPYSTAHDLRTYLKSIALGTGSSIYVTSPAKNAEEAVFYSAKALTSAQNDFSLENRFDFFNVYLAPYMRGVEYERMKRLARLYVYESQAARGRTEIGIEYGCPQALKDVRAVLPGGEVKKETYGDFSKEATEFGRALTEVYYEGDSIGTPFSSPRVAYKIRKENVGKKEYEEFIANAHEAAAVSCAPKFVNLLEYAKEPNLGVLQIVTINLPRVAYEAGGADDKFYEILSERLSSAREVMMIKRDILSQRIKLGLPSLSNQDDGFEHLDELVHSIGYLGLNEMTKAHTGKEIHEDASSLKFGREVVKHIAEVATKWSEENGLKWRVAQPPSESVSYRLAGLDYRQFSNKVVAYRDAKSKLRYSSSSHVRHGAVSLEEKIRIESEFHPFNTGGITLEVPVEKYGPKKLIELSRKIEKTKIRSWSFAIARARDFRASSAMKVL